MGKDHDGCGDEDNDNDGNTYLSMEKTKRGPTYRTTRRLPRGASDLTVRVGIPSHGGAPARALEVHDGHVAIAVFWVGILDRRHVQLESKETESFTRGQGFAVLGRLGWIGFEVEGVEVVVVQEADDAHPGSSHAVRVKCVEIRTKTGPDLAGHPTGDVAVGGDAGEDPVPGFVPAGLADVGWARRAAPETIRVQVVVEPYDDHDGLDLFPVDTSGAVVRLEYSYGVSTKKNLESSQISGSDRSPILTKGPHMLAAV